MRPDRFAPASRASHGRVVLMDAGPEKKARHPRTGNAAADRAGRATRSRHMTPTPMGRARRPGAGAIGLRGLGRTAGAPRTSPGGRTSRRGRVPVAHGVPARRMPPRRMPVRGMPARGMPARALDGARRRARHTGRPREQVLGVTRAPHRIRRRTKRARRPDLRARVPNRRRHQPPLTARRATSSMSTPARAAPRGRQRRVSTSERHPRTCRVEARSFIAARKWSRGPRRERSPKTCCASDLASDRRLDRHSSRATALGRPRVNRGRYRANQRPNQRPNQADRTRPIRTRGRRASQGCSRWLPWEGSAAWS